MRFLPPLAANLLLFLAAFGLGGLLRSLYPTRLLKVDRIATIILAGLGLLGTLLFLIGLFRFSKPVILAVLIPAALLGLTFIYKETKGLASSPTSHFDPPILPAAVIAFVVLITFIGGFAEPVGDIRADHISYHFLGPQVWLRDAAVHSVPDETHTSFPAIVEVLYASVMSLGGTRAAELFSVFSLTLLLVAYGLARRMGLDPKGAWWAAALVGTMPVVYRGSFAGLNDTILAGFFLLALRYALDATGPRDYALAGLFAGFAMGTKYTGIIVLFLTIVCVLAAHLKGEEELRKHKRISGLTLFTSCAIVVAAPWYLRNWLLLGSPIYPPPPALLRFFTPKYMSPEAIDGLAAWVRHGGAGMGHSFWDFLLLPFHFTYHPALFLNGVGGVGVDLLALVPFGIVALRKDLFARVILLFVLLQTIIWFVTEQEARFLIHVYVILAVLAIFGWRYVNAKAPRGGPLLSALAVACSMLYGLFMIVGYRVEDLRAAVSSQYELQRIAHQVPYIDSFEYLNDNPAVKKILVLAPRFPTFYLRKDYLKPVGRFGEQVVPGAHDTAKLLQNAAAMGITHVIDVRVDDKESPVQDFVLQDPPPNLHLIFQREDQRIYQVLP
jgi:hypothetical protein